ncbi:arabinofuranosidase catalytic domain-containing protein [Paraburkholderia sp. BL10I2N1]|uniref:arabinofuranosidase catalytic domain-containing protein n=1 Tax=Paraburkholderia sp. BL10I2N1 TaxID=1938796 RepID=UPI00105DF62D|nr:arabinofuranosidase catalytic domain-containing protein [Paraburkholderia sp. BL10I2N1]TDN57891.1 alpha-L-arabinofuranosidase B-like protein [Paraburkholderia sp. BL10I2N1]
MMSRGIGSIAVLLAMTVGLAACNGESSGTSASQAAGVSNVSSSPTNAAAQSNFSASTQETNVSLPCDVAATANTPCSAAHSVTRLLTRNYRGPLFQVQRASDNATQDIYPYTSSTLPNGGDHTLIGSANVKSANAFCTNTTCSVTYIYDQIDLVASLKGGAFGNVPATLTLNQDGTESLTVPDSGSGSQKTMTVPVLNGFATITLPGTGGTLTVQLLQPPTALTNQSPTLQLSIGNDLPALSGTPAKLGFVSLQGAQIPALGTLAGQAYRNRFGTVNQSIGDSDIAEYMVAGAHYSQSSTCCGTYGNMESSANSSTYAHGEVEGEMFALAFSNGNAAVFGYCDGDSNQAPNVKDPVCNALDINWPGVDAEAGVYLYGPQQPAREKFVTVLSKYSPVTASNIFVVKGGSASQSVLTALYDQAPPEALNFGNDAGHAFNGQWQGGLSLGEGGDGSAAPVQFFEGAVITKATSDTTDNAIQASIASFYGPPADKAVAACYATNLFNSPLSLATPDAWSQQNGGTAVPAPDISGVDKGAATVTSTNGSSVSNIHEIIRVQGGQSYSFTDYVLATASATVFPGGSIQTDDPSGTEFGWVLNTNTGTVVRGTWGAGQPTSLSAVKSGNWWKVTMTLAAPEGSNNASVFIDPPTSNAAGVRSQQAPYLSATHYCPSLAIVTGSGA